MLKDKEESTIVFRTYAVATRKIEVVSEVQVEKALRPVWQAISYIARGRKYWTVEVKLWETATARLNSATPVKIEEIVLLSIYFGRCTTRVGVENIPPEVNVATLEATSLLDSEEKVVVLQGHENTL